MELCPLPLLGAFALLLAACAVHVHVAGLPTERDRARQRPRDSRSRATGISLSVEQRLKMALQLQPDITGLPTAFVGDLLRCEHTEKDKDDSIPPRAGVVLDRPYVTALAAQLEAVQASGVWPQPPQMRNPELVALEQGCSAERAQWAATVVAVLSGRLDETSACKLLAALGTRGIVSLLGQRCVFTRFLSFPIYQGYCATLW